MASDLILGVHQLNEYVRRLLASDSILRTVQLRGEISGYKRHISGHVYFALKDERARVSCVLFKQHAFGLTFVPRDGMRVVATGSVSLFVRDGAYQVYCESLREEGLGDMYLRFAQLKAQLTEEGLFDPALKKPIPAHPKVVGVVTSPTGAVLRDIVRVARRRNPRIDICLAPAAVQGEGAAEELSGALDLLNAVGTADVILIGRGGGSMEDLWAFNEEGVARAIARSKIPVISCVGHETDFTIADFVADLRAPTPSAAAELAVPVIDDLMRTVDAHAVRLWRTLKARLALMEARLERLSASPALQAPRRALIESRAQALGAHIAALDRAIDRILERKRADWALGQRALAALSPAAVIERGYAVVRADGRAVPDAGALTVDKNIEIEMRGGRVDARVTRRSDV